LKTCFYIFAAHHAALERYRVDACGPRTLALHRLDDGLDIVVDEALARCAS
jgi:hypothetical protein